MTENQTPQAILSRFYFGTTTRPPSSLIVTIAPHRHLLGLIFPNFDLAPKRKKFRYCGHDLVGTRHLGPGDQVPVLPENRSRVN